MPGLATDQLGGIFEVGRIVNIPCVVTAIGGTVGVPTVTLETKYKGLDGNKDTLGPIDPVQVLIGE